MLEVPAAGKLPKSASTYAAAKDKMASNDDLREHVETVVAAAFSIAAEYRENPSGSHRAHLSSDSVPYPLSLVGAKIGAVLASRNLTCALVRWHAPPEHPWTLGRQHISPPNDCRSTFT